jgi:hypothetical protein
MGRRSDRRHGSRRPPRLDRLPEQHPPPVLPPTPCACSFVQIATRRTNVESLLHREYGEIHSNCHGLDRCVLCWGCCYRELLMRRGHKVHSRPGGLTRFLDWRTCKGGVGGIWVGERLLPLSHKRKATYCGVVRNFEEYKHHARLIYWSQA